MPKPWLSAVGTHQRRARHQGLGLRSKSVDSAVGMSLEIDNTKAFHNISLGVYQYPTPIATRKSSESRPASELPHVVFAFERNTASIISNLQSGRDLLVLEKSWPRRSPQCRERPDCPGRIAFEAYRSLCALEVWGYHNMVGHGVMVFWPYLFCSP